MGLPLRAAAPLALLLVACPDAAPPEPGLPRARVAADRSGHFLDRPFPSDELLTPHGTVDLRDFPVAGWPPARRFLRGWIAQARAGARGFSPLSAVYFRFDGAPAVPARSASGPHDAVRLRSLDSPHAVPVRARFVADARGDPYLPGGTLVLVPEEAHPLRSGERYVASVSRAVARRAAGWRPPPGAPADAAVATVFTVQDVAGELRALGAAVEAWLAAHPEALEPRGGLRAVARLEYVQGRTPEGHAATLERVTFVDGGSETTFGGPRPGAAPKRRELTGGPYEVFQTGLEAPLLRDPAGRPWQSAGPWARLARDPGRLDGAIAFEPGRAPEVAAREPVRVVVQVPRARPARAVVLWFHGSGGDAYEAVERSQPGVDLGPLRAALAEAGVAMVSADMPPFGRRFPLLERGFGTDQGMVNPANLAAMRDGPRQAAAEQRLLLRFARERLPALLPGRVQAAGLGLFGHSTGAQVSALAGVLHAPDPPDAMLLSGAGGFLAHYPFAADVIEWRPRLFGRELAAVPGRTLLGVAFGVPGAARERLDRHHPLLVPYQLLLAGADPLAVAPAQPVPIRVFTGTGDRQVPAESGPWLAAASPRGAELACRPSAPYDGHYCAFREEAGRRAFVDFASSLGAAP